ncbi:hypothetical protein LTR51_002474 [Lithohypha guttulata]|nr:hypothetical protein LTR51_002474 [Lithohypha guttulata]
MSEKTPETAAAPFDSLLNFRDVAPLVNKANGASDGDKGRLQDICRIKTIIDLRSKTEHIEAAQKYSKAVKVANSSVVPLSNDQVAIPLEIPRINYAYINLNGRGFERHLVWQLSYKNLAYLAGYMLLGYRLEGISIIGKNVLQPRGLIGLAKDTLQHSGPEIKEVFKVLSNVESYPVLVHCTQGKDRTGLIVLLVLLLCGIDPALISDDYTKSEQELAPEFEDRMKEISSIGLDETFAKCPSDFVPKIVGFIDTEYEGVENYLRKIGVEEEQIHTICKQMLL